MNKFGFVVWLVVLSGQVFAQHNQLPAKAASTSIPALMEGNFSDDYDIAYTINDTLWTQLPNTKYHIIACDTAAKYILLRNDDGNTSEGGLFTRIDFMYFTNMGSFHWGFCLTVYDAATVEEAKTKAVADRQHPKSGCNGYPFSRMKRRG